MSQEKPDPSHLSETGMTLKQLHHGLADIFNINARRIAAAFPVERYEDAEIYYIKGRRLLDEYNEAARAESSFAATVGRSLLKGAGYAAVGVGVAALVVLSLLLGTAVLPDGLSSSEKRSLEKDSPYGAAYDKLRRNFAADLQESLAARKKPKAPDIS